MLLCCKRETFQFLQQNDMQWKTDQQICYYCGFLNDFTVMPFPTHFHKTNIFRLDEDLTFDKTKIVIKSQNIHELMTND